MPLTPATRLGSYEIVSLLGSGGMGEVYKAKDLKLGRDVAIKVLREDLASDPERLRRFEQEARAASSLNHPNIVTIHDIGEHEGTRYISMEYVEGKTLREMLGGEPLPIKKLLKLSTQIADGLAKAHSAGIVHRDLKPENLMVTSDGFVKILDFGLAKLIPEPSEVDSEVATKTKETREGVVLGTVQYMSPEQAAGRPVDYHSDQFSLGSILYEMATGRLAFQKETAPETQAAIMRDEPEPITVLNPHAPAQLVHIIGRCLEKDSQDRYDSTRDLARELKGIEELSTAPHPPSPSSRHLPLTGIVGVGLAAILLVMVAALLTDDIQKWIAGDRASDLRSSKDIAPTHRQITFTGKAFAPTIAPDGRTFAYLTEAGEKQRLIVQDLSGGEASEIFEADVIHPKFRWAPDGAEILLWGGDVNSEAGVFLVQRAGGPARRFDASGVSWSPDGSQFVGSRVAWNEIEFTDKVTGKSRTLPLTGAFTWLWDVEWSPAGDLLLFFTGDPQIGSTIWTIKADGQGQQKVVEDKAELYSPHWSPKGDAIYYLRDTDAGPTKDFWKISVSSDSGKPTDAPLLVLAGLETGRYFTVAQDAKRLLYTREQVFLNLSLATSELARENQTATMKQLTTGTWKHVQPSVSTDGTQIAFARGDGQTGNIFVMPVQGGPARQITFMKSLNFGPVWSPDDKELAFISSECGKRSVWKIGIEGGTPKPLVDGPVGHQLAWSPGRRLLYQRSENRNFHFLDPKTEAETPLVQDDSVGWIWNPVYSPDGRKVAIHWVRLGGSVGPGIWVLSLDDSSTTLWRACPDCWPIGWSSDGNWLYVASVGGAKEVFRIRPNGEAETLFKLPPGFSGDVSKRSVSMTPDGRQFVYVVGETQSDVWIAENFDPHAN